MATSSLASYLRSHRLKSGMSQRELAELIGIIAHHQVSNHERSIAIPSLLVALSYEAIFRVPVAEMFPGLYETIKLNVEERLSQMEKKLQDSSVKGRAAQAIAHKIEWLWEHRNPTAIDCTE
jgi:transcriptional regulator with XRE-family HTH domain